MQSLYNTPCYKSLNRKHQYLVHGCLGGSSVIRDEHNPGFMPGGGATGQKLEDLSRVRMEMGKQNSRTFPGLFHDFFSFFKNSISSNFCIKQHEKMHFFSRKHPNEKAHSISLILTPVIKNGTTAQIE